MISVDTIVTGLPTQQKMRSEAASHKSGDPTMVAQRTLPFCRENHRKRLICLNVGRNKGTAKFIMYSSEAQQSNNEEDCSQGKTDLSEISESISLNADETPECPEKGVAGCPQKTRDKLFDITAKDKVTMKNSQKLGEAQTEESPIQNVHSNNKHSQVQTLNDEKEEIAAGCDVITEYTDSHEALVSRLSNTGGEMDSRESASSSKKELRIVLTDIGAKYKVASHNSHKLSKSQVKKSRIHAPNETQVCSSQTGNSKHSQGYKLKEEMDVICDVNTETEQSSNKIELGKAVQTDVSYIQESVMDSEDDAHEPLVEENTQEDAVISGTKVSTKETRKDSFQGIELYLCVPAGNTPFTLGHGSHVSGHLCRTSAKRD